MGDIDVHGKYRCRIDVDIGLVKTNYNNNNEKYHMLFDWEQNLDNISLFLSLGHLQYWHTDKENTQNVVYQDVYMVTTECFIESYYRY